MDRGDLEQLAISFYERHGLDPELPRGTITLARRELGPRGVVRADLTTSGPAKLFLAGGWRIGVKRGLPLEYQLFYVGHELAHYLLAREGCQGDPEIEAACDYLSAALAAPRPAVRRVYRFHGLDLEKLAAAFRSTQTGAGLRVGEVELPIAAVSPLRVRARAPGEFCWPDEATIRSWSRGTRPGLRKVTITDGRGRVVLAAGEE